MFTGLVEAVGTLLDVVRTPETMRLRVGTEIAGDTTLGESIAVNGVCLTVVENGSGAVSFDISPETARVTTIDALQTPALVNLERSMRADARVGGHFVQGHVDATGTIEAIRQEGDYYRVTVAVPASLMPLLVQKGSIAVDGVSLTVASIDDGRSQFDVQLIPFTWLHTRFQSCKEGTAVNIECDILGKYVVRALGLRPDSGDLRTAMKAFGPDGRSR
jgi:riboflavin synthase alpha subunit